MAGALYDAGLRRINISLDTLDPARFRELTRREGLDQVLGGHLRGESSPGSDPIKLNAIALKGFERARHRAARPGSPAQHGLELRFIEYMPPRRRWFLGPRQGLAGRRDPGTDRRGGRPPGPRAPTATPGPRPWITTMLDGGGPGRPDRLDQPAVLRELQPAPD